MNLKEKDKYKTFLAIPESFKSKVISNEIETENTFSCQQCGGIMGVKPQWKTQVMHNTVDHHPLTMPSPCLSSDQANLSQFIH